MRKITTTSAGTGPTDQASRPSPAPVDPDLHPSPEAAAAALRAWASLWNTPDEVVLLASSQQEAAELNQRARRALLESARLHGPAVRLGHVELAPGDRLVVGEPGIGSAHFRPLRSGASHGSGRAASAVGIPPGCLGDVRLLDPGGAWVVIDFPTRGVVRLAAAGLTRVRHAYAIPAPPGVGTRIAGLRVARPAHLGAELPGA